MLFKIKECWANVFGLQNSCCFLANHSFPCVFGEPFEVFRCILCIFKFSCFSAGYTGGAVTDDLVWGGGGGGDLLLVHVFLPVYTSFSP